MRQVLEGELNSTLQIVIQQSLVQEHFCTFLAGKLGEISQELGFPLEIHRVFIESGFVGLMAEFTAAHNESDLLISLIDFPYLFTKAVKPLVNHLDYKVYWPIPRAIRGLRRFSNYLDYPGDEILDDWSQIGLHLSTKFVPAYSNQNENGILYRIISFEGDNYLLAHEKEFSTNFTFKNPSPSKKFENI